MTLLRRAEAARPRLLDSYIVREMLPPTGIGLLVFTFVLLIDQIPRLLAVLVARSADLATILRVFLNLLPSILAVTIPMAFLLGVLLAFGRMASDSEIVALRAVGVSPSRLLAPVMMLAAGDDRAHVLHQRRGAAGREPGTPAAGVRPAGQQGAHRRAAARLHRQTCCPGR